MLQEQLQDRYIKVGQVNTGKYLFSISHIDAYLAHPAAANGYAMSRAHSSKTSLSILCKKRTQDFVELRWLIGRRTMTAVFDYN